MVTLRSRFALSLLAALALVPAAPGHGQDYKVSLTLEPRTTVTDRLVELRIEVEGGGLGFLRAAAHFELENLEVFDGPFRSERLRFTFGEAQRTATLRWRLRPLGPGTGRVRSIEVEVRGQRLELPDQTVEVLPGPGPSEDPPEREEDDDPFADLFERRGRERGEPEPRRAPEPQVFLRAEVTPRRPYVGQQTRYALYLYTQADVESIHPRELPGFHGFWVVQPEGGDERETEMVEVDGQTFARARLFERVLYPMRPGTLEVEPAQVELVARRTYVAGPGARFSRPERLRRRSDPVAVEVVALPEAPAGFTGAVGQFRLAAEIDPPRPRVGEAAVLELTLSGSGNVEGLPQPALPPLPGCKIYPPQESSRRTWRGGRLFGERTWRFVLVPEVNRRWTLPPIELPYFDPGTGRFELAATEPLDLAALPVPPAEHLATAEMGDETEGSAADRDRASPPGLTPWWLAVPVGAAIVLLLARKRRPAVSPAVAELEAALGGERPGRSPHRVAGHLEAAWRRFLEQTWEIDHQLPARRWPEELAARGAAPEAADELRDIVEELQELRLLPELAALDAPLRDLRARSRALARRLTGTPPAGRRR